MKLPDLCLLPHEAGDLAPGEPLCAPATCRLISRKHPHTVYLARRVGVEIDLKREHIWVARRESASDSSSLAPLMRDERGAAAIELSQLFANLMRGKWERRLFFDRDFRLASTRDWYFSLWLSEGQAASWSFASDRKNYPDIGAFYHSRFRWPHLAEGEHPPRQWRSDVSDAQLEREVAAMLCDSASDGSFTFRWLQLKEGERDKLLFPTTRESFERCEQMLRWILHSDDQWNADDNRTWIIKLDPYYVGQLKHAEVVAQASVIRSATGHFSLSERLSRLLQLVIEHFDPSFNRTFAETSVFRALWSHLYSEWIIAVAIPTAHEQLEAKLQLRDFLRDKLTPTELAGLMRA